MDTGQKMPKVTVTKSGVFQVSPAEIFKSEVGRAAILKTAELGAARASKLRQSFHSSTQARRC